MSVCIVAEYPLPSKMVGGRPVGVIVCTDTKGLSAAGRPLAVLLGKQRPVSQNIMVCYTSSNFSVTSTALNYSSDRRISLRRLGRNLQSHHGRWGGLTELLAVVWHRDREAPQVLELMPDAYEPTPRHGIIGIGDTNVLDRFQELLGNHIQSQNPIPWTAEGLENFERSTGHKIPHDFSQDVLNATGPKRLVWIRQSRKLAGLRSDLHWLCP